VRAEHDFLMDGVDARPIASLRVDEGDRDAAPKHFSDVRGWTPVNTLISVDLPRRSRDNGVDLALFERQIHRLSACVAPKLLSSFFKTKSGSRFAVATAAPSRVSDIKRPTRSSIYVHHPPAGDPAQAKPRAKETRSAGRTPAEGARRTPVKERAARRRHAIT